jgi:hypothetical protein
MKAPVKKVSRDEHADGIYHYEHPGNGVHPADRSVVAALSKHFRRIQFDEQRAQQGANSAASSNK